MARIKKLSYKYKTLSALPKSYQKICAQYLRNKKDDMPYVFRYAGYRFTIWSADLPIEIANY